jgi:hypothetical protein
MFKRLERVGKSVRLTAGIFDRRRPEASIADSAAALC